MQPLDIKEWEPLLTKYFSEKSNILVMTFDSSLKIVFGNQVATELFGGENAGRGLSDFIGDVDINEFKKNLSQFGFVGPSRFNLKLSSGETETLYLSFFKGLGTHFLCIGEESRSENLTFRKQLLSINARFSTQSRTMAKNTLKLKKLNELKNQFLGMAAHDLRNPISSIYMYAGLLLSEKDLPNSPDKKNYLERIQNSSSLMLSMLDELLDLNKIESGKFSLDLQEINLNSLIQSCIEMLDEIAQKKKIKLVFHATSTFPSFNLDYVKISQAVINLVSNAIKYTFPNTQIFISAKLQGQDAVVSIEDSGQGIAEKDLKRLFLPFQTASIKGTAGEKSTGLGLAIVQKMVQLHQGRCWVKSELAKGSIFYFSIPTNLKQSSDATNAQKKSSIVWQQQQQQQQPEANKPFVLDRRAKILVIDDAEDIGILLKAFFKDSPFDLSFSCSGVEGLKILKENNFDLVLLDIETPDLSGFEVATEFRKFERETRALKNIPLIGLSGHSLSQIYQKALSSGFTDFVSKPIAREVLLDIVRSSLSKPAEAQNDPTFSATIPSSSCLEPGDLKKSA